MEDTLDELYSKLVEELSSKQSGMSKFSIPLSQNTNSHFPDYLAKILMEFQEYYSSNLFEIIEKIFSHQNYNKEDNLNIETIQNSIENFSTVINKSVNLYYEGNILESTNKFTEYLKSAFFNRSLLIDNIKSHRGKKFYRARVKEDSNLTKEGIFHVKFQDRHLIGTNRFSVPGFPSLYLGDSTYVCWEEFDRPKLNKLWFSRYKLSKETKDTTLLLIIRIEDFIKEIHKPTVPVRSLNDKINSLFIYISSFPLMLSCSVKVKHQNGRFKPEYIIPQLLSQAIAQSIDISTVTIHGIKYPSTKVDYHKLQGVKAYNYFFPAKKITSEGFCTELIERFKFTEPTTLELEELNYNPSHAHRIHGTQMGGQNTEELALLDRKIEIIKDSPTTFITTSFGQIEFNLKQRNTSSLPME